MSTKNPPSDGPTLGSARLFEVVPKRFVITALVGAALLVAFFVISQAPPPAARPWVDALNQALGGLGRNLPFANEIRYAMVALGAALLLFGKRIYYAVLALVGALFGALVGALFQDALAFAVCSILGGLVAVFLHDLVIFLPGAIVGATIGAALGFHDGAGLIISAVVVGLVFVALFRALLILTSSMIGAFLTCLALGLLHPGVFLLLWSVGVLVQGKLFGFAMEATDQVFGQGHPRKSGSRTASSPTEAPRPKARREVSCQPRALQVGGSGPAYVVGHAVGALTALTIVGITASELLPRFNRGHWSDLYVDLLVFICATVVAYIFTWVHTRIGGVLLIAFAGLTVLDDYFRHRGRFQIALLMAPMALAGALLLLGSRRRQLQPNKRMEPARPGS